MAALLPTGFSLSALPQAPNIGDPRLYAADPQGALATAHAGLLLGQEMANIENQKAKRALEAEQIKLLVQKNKLDVAILEATQRDLPAAMQAGVEAELEKRRAEKAASLVAGALANERLSAGAPAAQVQSELTGFARKTAEDESETRKSLFEASTWENLSTPENVSLAVQARKGVLADASAGPIAQKRAEAEAVASGSAAGEVSGQLRSLKLIEESDPAGENSEVVALRRGEILSKIAGTGNINGQIVSGMSSRGLNPFNFRKSNGMLDYSAMSDAMNELDQRRLAISQGAALNPKQITALANLSANASAMHKAANNYRDAGWLGTGSVVGQMVDVWNNFYNADVGEAKSRAAGNALSLFGLTNALVEADLITTGQATEVVKTLPKKFGVSADRYLGELEQSRRALFDMVQGSAKSNQQRLEKAGVLPMMNDILKQLATPIGNMSMKEAAGVSAAKPAAVAPSDASDILVVPNSNVRVVRKPDGTLTGWPKNAPLLPNWSEAAAKGP